MSAKRFVVKYCEPDERVLPHYSDENGYIIVRRDSFLRQSVRKKHFLHSMINLTTSLKTVDINIDSDSVSGDTTDTTETESDTSSELNTSEEEFSNSVISSERMECSDESLVTDSSVILESFFT